MRHSWGRTPRIAVSIGAIAASLFTGAGGTVAAEPVAAALATGPKSPAGVWTRVTGNVGDIGELSFELR